jgi:hypothetical protein
MDSHPQVLYRHEPDISQRSNDIPLVCDPDDCDQYIEPMRRYVRDLLDTRTIRSAGKPPVFRKVFDTRLTFGLRLGAVHALRALERLLPEDCADLLTPPDFGNPLSRVDVYPVIKSVSSAGRLPLMLRAVPSARVILIVRNPLGQVASRLEGLARGKFRFGGGFDRRLLTTRQARQFGLTDSIIDRLPLPAQLTWEWAVLNGMALDAVRGLPQTRVVRYLDLLDAPIQHAQELLSFIGLSWHPATEHFIHRSTRHRGPDQYYQVFRNAATQRENWRSRIDGTAQHQILDVMRNAEMAQLWPELLA